MQEGLLRAIDEDTEAFNQVSAVLDSQKQPKKKKKARREAMQSALKGAAVTPFSMMEKIVDALKSHTGCGWQNQIPMLLVIWE